MIVNIKETKPERHTDEDIDFIPVLKTEKFSVSYVFLKPKKTVPLHRHKFTHSIYFVEKGTIKVIIDNKENIVEEKSFIEIPPEKAHKVINETDEEVQFIAYEVPPDDDDFELVEEKELNN